MPLVLQWVRSSKTMTRHLFHVVWGGLFEELVGRGLQSVVTVLQRDYFFRADDAWDASWRTAPDCCMPGTGVGFLLHKNPGTMPHLLPSVKMPARAHMVWQSSFRNGSSGSCLKA